MDITREKFVELFNKCDKDDLIVHCFELHGDLFSTDTYVFIRCEEDVTILNKLTLDSKPQYINWYKLYHIGRALHIEGFKFEFEIIDFWLDVVDELKYKYCPNPVTYETSGNGVDVNSLYPSLMVGENACGTMSDKH